MGHRVLDSCQDPNSRSVPPYAKFSVLLATFHMAQIFPESAPSSDRDDLAAHMPIQKVETDRPLLLFSAIIIITYFFIKIKRSALINPIGLKMVFFTIIPKNFFKVKQATGFDFLKKLCYNIIKKKRKRYVQ